MKGEGHGTTSVPCHHKSKHLPGSPQQMCTSISLDRAASHGQPYLQGRLRNQVLR